MCGIIFHPERKCQSAEQVAFASCCPLLEEPQQISVLPIAQVRPHPHLMMDLPSELAT